LVIGAPPFDAGAVHDTTDWSFWYDRADTAVAAPGRVAGVAGAVCAEGALLPEPLLATTLNTYAVPLVRPVTVQVVEVVVQVMTVCGEETGLPVTV